jgi:hypothetical protein
MDQKIKEELGQSATEVFSTMYFLSVQLLADLPSKENWDLDMSYIAAKIDYSGPLSATIRFFFPDRLVRNTVEGFLGIEADEISQRQASDTMKEAANMVVGSFLGKVDPDGSCKLGIPTTEYVTDFSPEGLGADAEVMAFTSEFGHIWLTYK